MYTKHKLGFAFYVLGLGCASASTINFTAGDFSISGLGDEKNTGYDKVSLTGIAGGSVLGVDSLNPQTAKIATLNFQAGLNCIVCSPNPSGSATISFIFGSSTQQLVLPFTVTLSPLPGPDTLNLSAGQPLLFAMGNGDTLTVTALSITNMKSSGQLAAADLMATFSESAGIGGAPPPTPEPGTVLLLLTGLVGMAVYRHFNGMWRANSRATVSAFSCGNPMTPARKTPFAKT